MAVLYRAGELRKLWHPAHLAGILIVVGIFAAWAVPYWRAMQGTNLAQTWSAQFTGRLGGDDFKLGHWLLNIPRALAYFLPWTLLLPLVWRAEFPSPRETNLSRALSSPGFDNAGETAFVSTLTNFSACLRPIRMSSVFCSSARPVPGAPSSISVSARSA